MSRSRYMIAGAVVALAEARRQFRDLKGLVDRTLANPHRFWLLVPLLVAAWAFMVSDDERFAVLEGVADRVLNVVPLERRLPS